ncbi:similar to Saccharomyces cerevisiae YOR223W Protein of unknown function found in the ER and vacuole lumen [Maudiozyma barnettii]|uniref:DSC E3 ubiquitin ligase complex subunit 3 C-terminal domain-containing protein n=1 Tax=Maudiozyma barnettii TaxID=61262 RepID=A0A8H2VDF9_9SACH|nr:Dsc3p [Kazachstania barnettii]CAB4253223.1 similar to Saccharomyces cerevisiae YOR223W Protein of unknown function found in the ER and vacuole lumen [Kazachstania barnettii]CAD1780241.1 similar to Saccharomyces cerevisiae YOR223W Protein of unknown function found in the ER and vacuole lumen [Kazachstania barnettii]
MSREPLLPTTNPVENQKYIKVLFTTETIEPILLDITTVPPSDLSLKSLRQTIRNIKSNDTKDRTLRFLRSGSIITASYYQTQVNNYLKSQNNEPFFIHCVIGVDRIRDPSEIQTYEQQDDDGVSHLGGAQNQNGNSMGAIGFDRLRSVGFSDEEIDLLRSQFRSTYGDLENRGNDNDNDTTENINVDGNTNNNNATDIRELEEQWMENGVGDNDDRFNSVPNANFKHNIDLLVGISVGFTFGVFSLVIMKFDGLFNKRQKMSIFAGLIVNVIFSLLRSTDE